ncbi:replication initiation protein [Bacillus paranthracis]|uniref:replication initiation protein n=1 Tax=Bacillus TaxID=1386 RepID=UPI000771A330|nr:MULTISPECIES: replication initiation protein [Bacillus]KXI55183.1 initiator RepB protein [Bacillus cereus]MCW4578637.1 replication initiation protein [Bacillus pacificus]KAB7632131.1 replication initiation protein [Bacillus sp. B4-WWTP-NA-D-NA-NA]MDA1509363.1 replication initiation protein [Bacillus cereus group sp. TH36-2LC]MDA1790904.1 replication initiation protein [Bacillus cereus group sp. BY5-1LC]
MSINQDLQIKENNIVSKSNTLIEANSRLNLVEQKMLLCLASNIEPNDRDFKTYTFPIKQFHDLLGLNGSTKYTELSKITKELLSKVIEIRAGEELIQVSWLSSAIYNRNKGTIDMRFDPLLKPFLLELSSKFTSYRLANVVKLKSTYAIRIYELLKQYEDLKERTISLENLRYYLDAMDVYPNYANFKQRVLKPSQKELNQKTDISFEFEEIKLGRKVQKIRFIIRSQKKKDSDLVHFEKKLDKFQQPNTFEQKIKRFEERCKEKVFPKVFEKWEEHKEIVLEIIEDIRFRSDIDSPIGYVEFILNSRLKELSDKKILNNSSQNEEESKNNKLLEIDTIIDSVISKYSTATGAIATFLVKDTAIEELVRVVSLEEAEAIWKEKEEFVMDKIYGLIKRNRNKKRY